MSRTNGEQRAMDQFEDDILAQLANIPIATEVIRTKIAHTTIRFPETRYILESVFDELHEIASRTDTVKQAASQYHRLRWGKRKGKARE